VNARDRGCLLRGSFEAIACSGYGKDGKLIFQADRLITRATSAAYADSRLVVCVCKGRHGWKSVGGYARVVRTLLPPDRIKLWDACEKDSWRPHRDGTIDWRIEIATLNKGYASSPNELAIKG
jgi:hypothetical protein